MADWLSCFKEYITSLFQCSVPSSARQVVTSGGLPSVPLNIEGGECQLDTFTGASGDDVIGAVAVRRVLAWEVWCGGRSARHFIRKVSHIATFSSCKGRGGGHKTEHQQTDKYTITAVQCNENHPEYKSTSE